MDADGLGDVCDACPNDSDNDADGDGVCGDVDAFPNSRDVGGNIMINGQRIKHGGGLERVEFEEVEIACGMRPDELLVLDEALTEMEDVGAFGAKIVQLQFFGGLTQVQIAQVLGISLAAVGRS